MVGCEITIKGSYASKLVGTFVLLLSGVTAHPLESRWSLAPIELGSIQCPQVSISFHLVNALGNLDGILAVAIDGQRQIRWSDSQDSKDSSYFGTVVGSGVSAGNVSRTFQASSIRERLSAAEIKGCPEQGCPACWSTRILDASSISIGYDATFIQEW